MALPDGTPIAAIDATLGIPGAPQSASGQTALFCGARAAEIANRHRNGYPDRALRRVILKKNLLSRLAARGGSGPFPERLPGFSPRNFTAEHVRIQPDGRLWFSPAFPERFKRMISVTSCMLLASGQKPFGADDIRAGSGPLPGLFQPSSSSKRGCPCPNFPRNKRPGIAARRLPAL